MRKLLIAALIVCTVIFLMTVFGEQAVETPGDRIVPNVDIKIAKVMQIGGPGDGW